MDARSDAGLLALGDERFVSLTTFRRSGVGVPTAIWIVRAGDRLLAITPADTGKVKRLRHTARVTLRPCNRRGAVADDAPEVEGIARLREDAASVAEVKRLVRAKYGLEYRVFMAVEAILKWGNPRRLAVEITPAGE